MSFGNYLFRNSRYLHKKQKVNDSGRTDAMHGKAGRTGAFENAISPLRLEKSIRQLCLTLDEPLPLPLQVLEEYLGSYQSVKAQKTKYPWQVEDFKGEHNCLKKRMIQKLLAKE